MGEVKSLMHYFLVPKREEIRLVYNGTSSGLNLSLWALHFYLTTVRSTLTEVERGTFMADRNIGEMFLNLMLSEGVRLFYAG